MEASHPLGYGLVVRYLVFTTEITQVRILDLLDKKGYVKLLKGPHLCKCCTNCTWTEVLPNSTWIEFYSHPSKQRAFHQKKKKQNNKAVGHEEGHSFKSWHHEQECFISKISFTSHWIRVDTNQIQIQSNPSKIHIWICFGNDKTPSRISMGLLPDTSRMKF